MKKLVPLIPFTVGFFCCALSATATTLPAVSVSSVPTSESLLTLDINLTLTTPAVGGESFVATLTPSTASAIDFEPLSTTPIVLKAGVTTKTITIGLVDDTLPELNETFQLVLSQPAGLTLTNPTSTHTITSDDSGIVMPSFFSDGMVLQREKAAAVWGYALPGSAVTVQFAGQSLQTTADANSRFEVTFNNLTASSVGRPLVVTSQGVTQTITNVLVGEVWMGAGQSNMDFPLNFLPSPENDNEIATANDPLLRIYVPIEQARRDPQVLVDGDWLSATPGDLPDFSALAYYYGKKLRAELGVPVAILECAWGGQPIEGFISEAKLETFPEGIDALGTKAYFYGLYEQALADFEIAHAAWVANPVGPEPVFNETDPQFEANLGAQIYNGMVAPIAGYGMRGILWNQGEANTFWFSTSDYAALLQALAADWRSSWGEELPFYFMQLPNFVSTDRPLWVDVQDAQRRALGMIPNSGMVVGNDIGNPNDIHPANKSDFADRLALWSLANEYGQTTLVPSGPLYVSSAIQGASVVVEFDYSAGLTTRDSLAPGGFELKGDGGIWVPATAVLSGQTVVVSATGVSAPTAIRYAWAQNPTSANLVNAAGLPASVFEAVPDGVGLIELTTTAPPINEGIIGMPVTFTLASPAVGGERFNFSLPSGTAIADVDYIDYPGGIIEFAVGETSQTLVLTIIDDALFEQDETFSLAITQPVGLYVPQPNTTLTILNDDAPDPADFAVVTVTADPINEGLIGYPVTFTLSKPAVGSQSVRFDLVPGVAGSTLAPANPLEDFIPWEGGTVTFSAGETSQTIFLTLVDDAVIEPNENFSMTLFNPIGLILGNSTVALTIVNDDSVLDDFGDSYGLPTAERAIESDGDNDGIGMFLEYAFNLNPTVTATPDYVPGQLLPANGEPYGLPVLRIETDPITGASVTKYQYLRRTDSYPKVIYITEISPDAVNFTPAEPDEVVEITEFWEEVTVIIGGTSSGIKSCYARVRIEVEDDNGDGF
ncbi:MAG: Calx-beta domain-containing protein [Roseibacillus sp.]